MGFENYIAEMGGLNAVKFPHAMKTYSGGGGIALRINLGLDGDEWSASRPGCLTPREKTRAPFKNEESIENK
jgi:hypothetical protein